MPDTPQLDLQDHLDAVNEGYSALVTKSTLLEIDCECLTRRSDMLSADNERLQSELECVTALNKRLVRENEQLKRTLMGIGNLVADESNELIKRGLRGSPVRDDLPMPRIVRAGPAA